MNDVVPDSTASDIALRIDHFEAEACAFTEARLPLAGFLGGREFDPAAGRDALHGFRSVWSDQRIAGLREDLRSISAPATRTDVAMGMAALLASFPSGGAGGSEVYGRFLVEDVAAARPSMLVLNQACRDARRKLRFLPTISEVLAAIESAEAARKRLDDRIETTPALIGFVEQEILKREGDLAFRARRAAQIEARQAQGEGTA